MTSVESLCDPRRVAEAFRAAKVPLAESGGLRLDRAWPNRSGGLSATYRANGDLWSIHGPVATPPRAARQAIRAGRVFYLPEITCWGHRFPFDPFLPALAEYIGADRNRGAHACSQSEGRDVSPLRVVSYKPLRRCVLKLGRNRFVKILRPAAAAEIASVYAAIATQRSFGAMQVSIPETVDLERGVLEWQRAPGRPLFEDRAASEIVSLLHRVGSGLGRFQRACPRFPRQHRGTHELETVGRWVERAAAVFPGAQDALRCALSELAGALPSEDGAPLVPAHRDFHQGQLLAESERLTLLDLDTACLAPAELDVANFLAHLRLEPSSRDRIELERGSHAFLQGHAATAEVDLDVDRLRWYEASASLRLACVHAFRPPGWTSLSRTLVRSAMSRLSQTSFEQGAAR